MGVRNWLRGKLLDHELGVLGGLLERIESRQEQSTVELMAFRERFERLINRVSARMARAARDQGNELDPDDARILQQLRGRSGNGEDRGDVFGDFDRP